MHPETAFALTRDRQWELRLEADRASVAASRTSHPGLVQRLAVRVANWGRRPAIVAGRPVVMACALASTAP
jgi:hypothetical protein